MYSVDARDRVIALTDVPQCSPGAPLPAIVAEGHQTRLVYRLHDPDPNWDGLTTRMVTPENDGEPIALVSFDRCLAHMFGPPNDEAFDGHPLAGRGLHPYAAFEVANSSWIRGLERMNSVHPYHNPEHFAGLRHFVFAFHDETFECIAVSYEIQTLRGSTSAALAEASKLSR